MTLSSLSLPHLSAVALVAFSSNTVPLPTLFSTSVSDRQPHPLSGQVQPSLPQLLSQTFRPPDRGAPSETVGGATRGSCLQEELPLTALTPTTTLGLTTVGHPTFFWYVPSTPAEQAEILIRDKAGNDVYRTTVDLPDQPGIVSWTLPDRAPDLEIGQRYRWLFAIICNADDRLQDVFVSAGIERIAPDPILQTQLRQAVVTDYPQIYAEAGIWHDALMSRAASLQTNPEDEAVLADWKELLTSAGLEQIADKTLGESLQ